jgi:hypothetical protein
MRDRKEEKLERALGIEPVVEYDAVVKIQGSHIVGVFIEPEGMVEMLRMREFQIGGPRARTGPDPHGFLYGMPFFVKEG